MSDSSSHVRRKASVGGIGSSVGGIGSSVGGMGSSVGGIGSSLVYNAMIHPFRKITNQTNYCFIFGFVGLYFFK